MTTFRSFCGIGSSILMSLASTLSFASEGRPAAPIARWATFDSQAGQTFYALSLQAELRKLATPVDSNRVVVLIDTSASQTGNARTESIAIVRSMIQVLPKQSQVAIVACDVDAVDLGDGLQSPDSTAVQTAFEKLDRRLPLGTTDLAGALRSAQKILGSEPNGSIVYIGDGVIRNHILNKDEFRNLIFELVQLKTSVTSLAIGPILNVEGLAAIANHTGGRIFVRNSEQGTLQQVGQALANASIEPVFWVEGSSLPDTLSKRLPESIPPLRSDRDSIWVGIQADAESQSTSKNPIVLRGSLCGAAFELKWDVVSEKSNPDFAFLKTVVEKAIPDKGLYLPTAGSDALRALGNVYSDKASELVQNGRFALQSGDTTSAMRLAEEAIQRDPNNLEAQNLREAIQQKIDSANLPRKVRFVQVTATDDIFGNPLAESTSFPAADAAVPPANPFPAAAVANSNATPMRDALIVPAVPTLQGNSGYLAPTTDGLYELATAGDLLSQEEGLRRLKAERFQTEVDARLRDGRNQIARDPAGVESSLKLLLGEIRRAPELEPGARNQMEAKVRAAIESSSRSAAVFREQTARAETVSTQANATERLLAEQERSTASVQQLVERFNALMEQHLYEEANTEIAPIVNNLLPDTVISNSVEVESSIRSNQAIIEEIIYKKRRGFLDTINLVEKISVPFADEPPVVYPPADVWRALSARRIERFGSIDISAGTSPNERRIYDSLKQTVKPEFNGVALRAVIQQWSDEKGIPIVIDVKALENAAGGATPEDPITLQGIPEISLRSALRLILEPLELTYVIEDEVMKITTKDAGKARVLRIYPVGDLVVPIFSQGGGQGGGQGGQGGGMGGGMGGGGMGGGGMGGGMGGMGGGGGGGMFAVSDQPSKAESNPTSAKTPVSSETSLQQAEALVNKILSTEDRTARELIEKKLAVLVNDELAKAKSLLANRKSNEVKPEFQNIIEIVSLALRRGCPQPWMYEALSLSMQVCEYPAEEIRRVLLSAVDFSGDVEDAIKIGKYLARHGMPKEALVVLRDAVRSQPLRADIYQLALPIAMELQDIEALKWTCVGVLSQAWPKNQAKLVDEAEIAAKATLIRMLENGQVVEAKVFEEQLKESQKRDVVVRVSWTGKADLDLSVLDPTGTVCSSAAPRTMGGGIHLNDGNAYDTPTVDGFSESYACPQGFTGEYQILIERIWGEVAGGKVTLDILTDFGTPEQSYRREQIVLSEKDVLVKIAVKNGHRETPLVDAALEKTVSQKLAAGRTVLAQQLNNLGGNSGSLNNNASGNFGNGLGGVANNPFFNPFRGAVGYRPNITVLPEGITWMPQCTAVISGDRRYVRVANFPRFSSIIQVDTFNFITGGGSTSSGSGGSAAGGGAGGFGGGGGGGGGVF